MCRGFGAIVTKNKDVFLCEPERDGNCSHSKILYRAHIEDNADAFNRTFVRIECPDWTIKTFRFDEDETLPGWAEDNKQEIIDAVSNRLDKIQSRVDARHLGILLKRLDYLRREMAGKFSIRGSLASILFADGDLEDVNSRVIDCQILIEKHSAIVGNAIRNVRGYVDYRDGI